MSETKDTWRTPIDIVRANVAKWDETGTLPQRVIGPDGEELPSSVIRRIVEAAARDRVEQQSKPREGPFRSLTLEEETPAMREYLIACRKRQAQLEGRPYLGPVAEERKQELWERDVAEYNRGQDERIQEQTPEALRRMNLEALEIEQLPNLDLRWGAAIAVKMFMLATGLDTNRKFLTLGGKPGTGKTLAAASALLHCVEEIRSTPAPGLTRISKRWTGRGTFFKASELVRMQNFGKDADKYWERLHRVWLLVIDDLGTEPMTDWWVNNLGTLIDARHRGELKTILTTNLSGAEFRTRYTERTIRRLSPPYGRFVVCEKPADPLVTP